MMQSISHDLSAVVALASAGDDRSMIAVAALTPMAAKPESTARLPTARGGTFEQQRQGAIDRRPESLCIALLRISSLLKRQVIATGEQK